MAATDSAYEALTAAGLRRKLRSLRTIIPSPPFQLRCNHL